MRNALPIIIFVALLTISPVQLEANMPDDGSTYTKIGQTLPNFELVTLEGNKIKSTSLKGKVVFLNFFATWCGPCRTELPHVEKEIWTRFKDDKNFVMLVIGREHTREELLDFKKETKFTFPLAPDPGRKVYTFFAEKWIPRNYVAGADGKIAFQSTSLEPGEFKDMVNLIRKKLDALCDRKSLHPEDQETAKSGEHTANHTFVEPALSD